MCVPLYRKVIAYTYISCVDNIAEQQHIGKVDLSGLCLGLLAAKKIYIHTYNAKQFPAWLGWGCLALSLVATASPCKPSQGASFRLHGVQ